MHREVWVYRSYNARERSQYSLRSDLVRINVLKSSASGPRACGPAAELGLHDCPVVPFRTCATRDVGLSSLSSANCLRSYRLSVCPPSRVPLSTSSYTRFVYVVLVNHDGCIVWNPTPHKCSGCDAHEGVRGLSNTVVADNVIVMALHVQ